MICRRITFALLLGLSVVVVSQTQHKPAAPASKPAQNEDAKLYRNAPFAFRFQIPYGWVDRTKEMRDQEATEKPDTKTEKSVPTDKPAREKPTGEVLLAVFERPPDAIGETINSAVVIASESAATYPGLRKAEDYLGPLTELTTSKGFKVEGDPDVLEIDSRQLIRTDFIKPLSETLTMHQSTLVFLANGHIVSFTFIAGSEDEVDDLIEGLHFLGMQPKR
jgi:hypothetical protein